MTPFLRLRLTLGLVLLSAVGGAASWFSLRAGTGEVYPFYHWKLYSQPLGWTGSYDEWRIYSRATPTAPLQRHAIRSGHTFTPDEYVYTLNNLAWRALGDSARRVPAGSAADLIRLQTFIRFVAPGRTDYHLVRESYRVMAIYADSSDYDTTTVLRF